MKVTEIVKMIHRDHSSVLHLLNKYNDEVKYNPSFRLMAERVTNIIIKTNKKDENNKNMIEIFKDIYCKPFTSDD